MLPSKPVTLGAPAQSSWWPAILLGGAGLGVLYLVTRKPAQPARRGGPKWYVSYNYLGPNGTKKRGDSGYSFVSRDEAQKWVDRELSDAEAEYGFSPDPRIYSR